MNSPWVIHGLMVLLLVQVWLNFRLNGLLPGLLYALVFGLLWSLVWGVICLAHNIFTSDLNDWRYLNLWSYAVQAYHQMAFNLDRLTSFSLRAWRDMSFWPGPEAFPVSARIHFNLFVFLAYLNALLDPPASPASTLSPAPQSSPAHTPVVHGSSESLVRLQNGHVDYRRYVNTAQVRNIAVQVVSRHAGGEREKVLQAAALFEYVKANVNYIPDPITMRDGVKVQGDYLASPADTLKIGGGDCDDQALLMASLLSAVGLENRILFVDSPNEGAHLLTQVGVDPALSNEIASILDGFYAGNPRVPDNRSYLPFMTDGRLWLMVDTTRDYVGDYRSLVGQGFIEALPNGRYQWHSNPAVF